MLIRNLGSFCEALIHEKVHFGGGGVTGRKKKGREKDEEKGEEGGLGREGRRGKGEEGKRNKSDCMVAHPIQQAWAGFFFFIYFHSFGIWKDVRGFLIYIPYFGVHKAMCLRREEKKKRKKKRKKPFEYQRLSVWAT